MMKKNLLKKVLVGLCVTGAIAFVAGCGGGDTKPANNAAPAAQSGD